MVRAITGSTETGWVGDAAALAGPGLAADAAAFRTGAGAGRGGAGAVFFAGSCEAAGEAGAEDGAVGATAIEPSSAGAGGGGDACAVCGAGCRYRNANRAPASRYGAAMARALATRQPGDSAAASIEIEADFVPEDTGTSGSR